MILQTPQRSGRATWRKSLYRPSAPRTVFLTALAVAVLLLGSACARFAATGSVTPSNASSAPLAATATPSPRPDLPPGGLTEAEAIAAARQFLPDDAAAVWATMPGTFLAVYDALAHRPTYLEQPAPDGIALDRLVWGVQFKVSVEVCGPAGGTCEIRDGLRTIVIDYETGEWLRTSTYAPNPAVPLPQS